MSYQPPRTPNPPRPYFDAQQPQSKAAHNTSKPIKKKSNILIRSFTFLLVIIVLFGALLFPIGNQTVLAFALDRAGLHKQALVVDMVAANLYDYGSGGLQDGGDLDMWLAYGNLDLNSPDSCGVVWNSVDFNFSRYTEIATKSHVIVSPENEAYADLFRMNADFQLQASMPKRAIMHSGSFDLKLDNNKLNEIDKEQFGNEPTVENVGIINGTADYEFGSNLERAIFDLKQFGFTADKLKFNMDFGAIVDYADINDYSSQDTEKIMDAYMSIFDVEVKTLLSDKAGQSLMQASCMNLESVEVEAPTDFTFGSGDSETKRQVRPIKIKNKDNYSQTDVDYLVAKLDIVFKDQNLRNHFKNKYEDFKTLRDIQPETLNSTVNPNSFVKKTNNQLQTELSNSPQEVQAVNNSLFGFMQGVDLPTNSEISNPNQCTGVECESGINTNSTEYTKEMHDQEVDEFFDSLTAEGELRTILEDNLLNQEQESEAITSSQTIFVDMQSKATYGYQYKLLAKESVEIDTAWDEIFKDGTNITFQIYDTQYLNQVGDIQVKESFSD